MPKGKSYMDKGTGGSTTVGAEGAPVRKHGGSAAIHDGIVSGSDPVRPQKADDGTPHAEAPRSV